MAEENLEKKSRRFRQFLSDWWGRIVVALILLVLVGVPVVLVWTGNLETGFSRYSPDPNVDLSLQPSPKPAKTLWDWMELLLIPLMLAAGAGFVAWLTNKRRIDEQRWMEERRIQEQRWMEKRRIDEQRRMERDRAREAALQSYFVRMSELMLEERLSASEQDSEIRHIARAQTLMVLAQLDGVRKGMLVRFLHESSLIRAFRREKKEQVIVSLVDADLSNTDLYGAVLWNANLERTNLRAANLSHASLDWVLLRGADLRGADLRQVTLSWEHPDGWGADGADLRDADLTGVSLRDADLGARVVDAANMDSDWFKRTPFPEEDREYLERHGGLTYGMGVDLSGANLTSADLSGADLFKAKLEKANLTNANLARANLTEVDLTKANLTRADLSGTDLSWANLTNTVVTSDQLALATSLKGATMPDGTKYTPHEPEPVEAVTDNTEGGPVQADNNEVGHSGQEVSK